MKDTLNKIAYDSTTAASGGMIAGAVSNSQLILMVCTLLAPVVRDLAIKLIDRYFSKKIKE